MSAHDDLMTLDAGGELRAADGPADRAAGRRDFLRRGVLAGGSAVAFATIFDTLASPAAAQAPTRTEQGDIEILNYALTLEYLETQFYRQAWKNEVWGKDNDIRSFVQTTYEHEKSHVDTLRSVLGKSAVKYPKFDFGSAVYKKDTFLATAAILEDTGVAAYSGQVGNILSVDYLKAATSIVTVEARHAAWVRFLLGGGKGSAKPSARPAPVDFDQPETKENVLKAVGDTGFIVG